MVTWIKVFLCMTVLSVAGLAFCQDPGTIVPPSIDEWDHLVASLGGLKGAGTMAILTAIVQGLMLLGRSQFGQYAGKWRLLALTGLTVVGGVIALKMQGMPWGVVITHTIMLSSFQVFVHQAWTQINAPAAPAPVVASNANQPPAA